MMVWEQQASRGGTRRRGVHHVGRQHADRWWIQGDGLLSASVGCAGDFRTHDGRGVFDDFSVGRQTHPTQNTGRITAHHNQYKSTTHAISSDPEIEVVSQKIISTGQDILQASYGIQ